MHNKDVSSIQYILNNENIISFNVKNNNVNVTSFNENAISLSDATFIDNPLLFEQKDNIGILRKYYFLQDFDEDQINIVSDILNKKKIAAQKFNSENYYEDLFEDFKNIFRDAQFNYNSRDERLKYKVSEQASEIELSNMASGCKAFGLLYTLLKSGVLIKDSLLVLDEPENHLHPAWQLKYAQILCKMVKRGFHILVTSHSPYLIQALHTYSVLEDIFDDKVNFYYAKTASKENYNEIVNVRDKNGNFDDSEIFKSLYAPFETLQKFDQQISEKLEKEYFDKK